MPALLIALLLFSHVGTTSFSKATSKVVAGASRAKYSLFLTVNGLIACFFFWLFGGFSVTATRATLIFGAIYAVIVAASILLNMAAYGMVSVTGVNVILNGCGLLCTSAMGALLFGEELSIKNIIRILIMLVAIALTFIDTKRRGGLAEKSEDSQKKAGKGKMARLVTVLVLIVAVSCANTVTLKYFTLAEGAADNNSFFFFTNVFLSAGCGMVLLFETVRRKGRIDEAAEIFKPRAILPIVGNTAASNIGSLVGVILLSQIDVLVYTPISSAVGIISGVVGSLIFKEKLSIYSYLAALVALAAVII